MIESRQLLQFLEIEKQKSFRLAAKELGLSQPALSRSIQRLEQMLGAELFHRKHQKVTLTVFGETLLPRAAQIVNALNDTNQAIDDLKGLSAGELKVGFGPVYAALLAAPSIGQFSDLYPRVRVLTMLGRFTELIEALANGQIDLFIGETSTLSPRKNYSIASLKKRTGIYCCRADHPIFRHKTINFDLVAEYPLISCQLPIRALPQMIEPEKVISAENLTFIYSDIVCDSYFIAREIAKTSETICLIPSELVAKDLEHGDLRTIDFKHKKISTNSGIVRLAERDPSPAMEKYGEIVKELDEQL